MAKVTKSELYVQIGGLLAHLVGEEVPTAPGSNAKLAELQAYVDVLQGMLNARNAKVKAEQAPAPAAAPTVPNTPAEPTPARAYNVLLMKPESPEEQEIDREEFIRRLENGGAFPRQLLLRREEGNREVVITVVDSDLRQSNSPTAFCMLEVFNPVYMRNLKGELEIGGKLKVFYIMQPDGYAKPLIGGNRTPAKWSSFTSGLMLLSDMGKRYFDDQGRQALRQWAQAASRNPEFDLWDPMTTRDCSMRLRIHGELKLKLRMSRRPDNAIGEKYINIATVGEGGRLYPNNAQFEGVAPDMDFAIYPAEVTKPKTSSLVAGAQVNEGNFEAPISRPIDDGFEAPVAPAVQAVAASAAPAAVHQFGKDSIPF